MKQYIINLFALNPFEGLPVAIIKLDKTYEDYLLKQIAKQNNLSLTCFILENDEGYQLKCFSPYQYTQLDNLGALGAFYILNKYYGVNKKEINFKTKENNITVYQDEESIKIILPQVNLKEIMVDKQIIECQGARPSKVFKDEDILCIYNSEATIRHLKPGFNKVRKLEVKELLISAPNKTSDVLVRGFGALLGENEEPINLLSCAHIASYWMQALNKSELIVNQYFNNIYSQVTLVKENNDVYLKTKVWEYLVGEINLF